MFLKELIISSKNEIIRQIPFKKGLNLIMDTAYTLNETKSGNNIGKTTLFRAIDFCLGATAADFYQDTEFKGKFDTEVKDFLENREVNFCLILKTTWTENTNEILLERKFGNTLAKETFSINGMEIKDLKTYKSEVEKILFNIKNNKPSLRQLAQKFVRKTDEAKKNVLKWIKMGKNEDYELVHLFLLGFSNIELLKKKLQLHTELRHITQTLRILKKNIDLNTAEQALKINHKALEDITKSVETYDVMLLGGEDTTNLDTLSKNVEDISTQVTTLNMRLRYSKNTLSALNKSVSNINPDEIASIYEQATKEFGIIHKKFEEVVGFHQIMISNKIDFVKTNIDIIEKELAEKQKELAIMLEEEQKLFAKIGDRGLFDDLKRLYKKQNELSEEKGKLGESISSIKKYNAEEKEKKEVLKKLTEELEAILEDFNNKNLGTFNKYFAEYSQNFYGEQFLLSYEEKSDIMLFKIDNAKGNLSSGKKKGMIAAFDLAYISFLNDLDIHFPHFVCHDSYEDVHINQIKTYFYLANQIDGQVITAILRGKLEGNIDNEFLEQNKILEISEEDKFFKIETNKQNQILATAQISSILKINDTNKLKKLAIN